MDVSPDNHERPHRKAAAATPFIRQTILPTSSANPSVTLLGSGQRTPWKGYGLDAATREAILHAEVGPLRKSTITIC